MGSYVQTPAKLLPNCREGRPLASRPPGYNQALQGDPSFVLQIAEKEQELLASQETVQVGEEGTLRPKGQRGACRGKTLAGQQAFRLDVSASPPRSFR